MYSISRTTDIHGVLEPGLTAEEEDDDDDGEADDNDTNNNSSNSGQHCVALTGSQELYTCKLIDSPGWALSSPFHR